MDSYVRLLRKTSTDKLWLIIDKILVKLPIIIVIISIFIRTIWIKYGFLCPLITENFYR